MYTHFGNSHARSKSRQSDSRAEKMNIKNDEIVLQKMHLKINRVLMDLMIDAVSISTQTVIFDFLLIYSEVIEISNLTRTM